MGKASAGVSSFTILDWVYLGRVFFDWVLIILNYSNLIQCTWWTSMWCNLSCVNMRSYEFCLQIWKRKQNITVVTFTDDIISHNSGVARISFRGGEHFRGSASCGVPGAEPPERRRIFEILQKIPSENSKNASLYPIIQKCLQILR